MSAADDHPPEHNSPTVAARWNLQHIGRELLTAGNPRIAVLDVRLRFERAHRKMSYKRYRKLFDSLVGWVSLYLVLTNMAEIPARIYCPGNTVKLRQHQQLSLSTYLLPLTIPYQSARSHGTRDRVADHD